MLHTFIYTLVTLYIEPTPKCFANFILSKLVSELDVSNQSVLFSSEVLHYNLDKIFPVLVFELAKVFLDNSN